MEDESRPLRLPTAQKSPLQPPESFVMLKTRRLSALLLAAACAAGAAPCAAEEKPTVLERLAAAMEPGTWREISSEMQGFDRDLWRGGGRSLLNFGARASWDPGTRQLLFLSKGGPKDGARFLAYSAADNRWSALPDPEWFEADQGPAGHRINANAVDPGRSLFYYQSSAGAIRRYDIRNRVWSELPAPADAPRDAATALVHQPEVDRLLGFFREEIRAWSEKNQAWSLVGACPHRVNMQFAEYHPVHKVVFFGRVRGTPLYRLDSEGTIAPLGDAPVQLSYGTAHVRADAAGGEFVVPCYPARDKTKLLTYDVTRDKWTERDDVSVPTELFERTLSASIPEYGVLLYAGHSTVYLYKHARREPADARPAP